MKHLMKPSSPNGNSIVEYLIPVAIIGMIGFAIFATTDFSQLFNTFTAKTNNGNLAGSSLEGKKMGEFPVTDIMKALNHTLPEMKPDEEQICYINRGVCLNVPVINASGAEAVGGLGGDDVDKLTRLMEQLPEILAELEVDPQVVDLVTQLSKQGHLIGQRLKEVERMCKGGVCDTATGENAKAILSMVKGNDVTQFLNNWQQLESYLNKNPNALEKFPEAHGIIKNQVTQIQQIIAGLNSQDQISNSVQVTAATTQTVTTTRENKDYKTWGGRPITQTSTVNVPGKTETVQVKTGVTLTNVRSNQVRQNSNNICDQGGDGCIYRSYGSDYFEG